MQILRLRERTHPHGRRGKALGLLATAATSLPAFRLVRIVVQIRRLAAHGNDALLVAVSRRDR
jgi:hypothetical protein